MAEDAGELLGVHPAKEGVGPFGEARVHPHVEVAVAAGAEAAFFGVELVGADAEVGEDAVHVLDAMQAQEVGGEAEVLGDELEPRVIRDVVGRVRIAVKPEQASLRSEPIEDARLCPPPPNVQSTYVPPGCRANPSREASNSTGTW